MPGKDIDFYTDEDLITQIIDDEESVAEVPVTELRSSIDVGRCSVIGARKEQQDTLVCSGREDYDSSKRMLAAVFDGMGGMNGGALVSQTCANELEQAYAATNPGINYRKFYQDLFDRIDQKIAALKDAEGNPLKGGSTVVSVIIENGMLYWASVGDSRIYLFRRGRFIPITRDHNYLSMLMERVGRGQMTLEEAKSHPKREALISFLGMNGLRYLDCNVDPIPLQSGDFLLLCSDGLYRALSDMEIVRALLMNESSMDAAVLQMVTEANDKHLLNQDNTTVIAIRYQ